MKVIIFIFSICFFCHSIWAADTQLMAISQGISSPNQTSVINYSSGFTNENPVGVIYQTNLRLSIQHDEGEDDNNNESSGTGGEIGIGNGRMGFAVGFYEQDCEECEGDTAGAVGFTMSELAIGLRFEEEIYSIGFLINPSGTHRIGLMGELNDPEGEENNISSYGLGYSYVSDQITLSIDASKRDHENPAVEDDRIIVTPGLGVRIDRLALTVSNEMIIDDEEDKSDDDDDELWWGLGYGTGTDFHVAFYADYVNDWAVVGSLFF